jgi:hypothetical protein
MAIRREAGREDADGCWVWVQSTVIIETCLSDTSIYLRPKGGVELGSLASTTLFSFSSNFVFKG